MNQTQFPRISFGIMGNDEECCGNEICMLGEAGLFQHLVEKNSQKFKELGVKKVIALCPHGYNTMRNDYPALGGDFEVHHYTQILSDLARKTKASYSPNKS